MSSNKIKVGSRVKLHTNVGDEDEEIEVGVVVHICLSDNDIDDDAYIAFFGSSFPERAPEEEIYILRYFVGSLELIVDPE